MTDIARIGEAVIRLVSALNSQGLATKTDDVVIRLEGRTFDQLRMALMSQPANTINTTDVFDYGRDRSRVRFLGVIFEQGPYRFK